MTIIKCFGYKRLMLRAYESDRYRNCFRFTKHFAFAFDGLQLILKNKMVLM